AFQRTQDQEPNEQVKGDSGKEKLPHSKRKKPSRGTKTQKRNPSSSGPHRIAGQAQQQHKQDQRYTGGKLVRYAGKQQHPVKADKAAAPDRTGRVVVQHQRQGERQDQQKPNRLPNTGGETRPAESQPPAQYRWRDKTSRIITTASPIQVERQDQQNPNHHPNTGGETRPAESKPPPQYRWRDKTSRSPTASPIQVERQDQQKPNRLPNTGGETRPAEAQPPPQYRWRDKTSRSPTASPIQVERQDQQNPNRLPNTGGETRPAESKPPPQYRWRDKTSRISTTEWNISVFQSLPWPQVYKPKQLDVQTAPTDIGERMGRSQELTEFQRGTVIGCHLCYKSSREISSLLNIPQSTVSGIITQWE
ncbi:hypothetical protein NFI96_018084, partial [Prochilodus magdalenae]